MIDEVHLVRTPTPANASTQISITLGEVTSSRNFIPYVMSPEEKRIYISRLPVWSSGRRKGRRRLRSAFKWKRETQL